MNQIPYDSRFVTLAPELVVDAVQSLRRRVQPPIAAHLHLHRAAVHETPEHSRDGSDVQAGPRCDFPGSRQLPEVDHRDIDAPLGLAQGFQVPSEVLRVLVYQCHQLFHQLAHRPMPSETGNDDQQAWAAAGQDLQRPDLASADPLSAHSSPQPSALPGTQWLETNGSEQFEEWFACVIQSLKPTCGRGEQHDLRFRLQHCPQLPAQVPIGILYQRLQVLNDEHELLAQPIGSTQHNSTGAILNRLIPPASGQRLVACAQLLGELWFPLGSLPS